MFLFMTKQQEQRKQEILSILAPLWNEESNESMYEISKRQVNKLTRCKSPMRVIKPLLKITSKFGLNAPLYVLGLEKMPKYGMQWMGNISRGRYEIDAESEIAAMRQAASQL